MSSTLIEATTQDLSAGIPEHHRADISVRSQLVPGTATQVSIDTGTFTWTIDEPEGLGGTNLGANPVEHLFAALGSCTVITYQVWAAQLGLTIEQISVDVDGAIDTRGFFGLDDTVRPGFADISVQVTVTGPESTQDYLRLADAVAQHCPVLDNLSHGTRIHRTFATA